jgi:hypothetical protein
MVSIIPLSQAFRRAISPSMRVAAVKAAIVLVPSYTAAWITGQMIYVVPTLAASGIFASSLSQDQTNRNLDDGDDGDDGESDDCGACDA